MRMQIAIKALIAADYSVGPEWRNRQRDFADFISKELGVSATLVVHPLIGFGASGGSFGGGGLSDGVVSAGALMPPRILFSSVTGRSANPFISSECVVSFISSSVLALIAYLLSN